MNPTESERHRLLYELGCAFAAQLDLDELIPTVMARCREVLQAESAAILLLDEAKDELYFPYVAGEAEVAKRLRSVRFPASKGIAGAVLTSGKGEVIADVAADTRFYGEVDRATGLSTGSMLVSPLRTRRGPIGVIELINKMGGGAFAQDDLDLLESLSGSIAVAIENACMFAELKGREERLRSEVGALRRDIARRDGFKDLVGTSRAMFEVFRLMESAATSAISVLIQGETGTGKELVARGVHTASERAKAPFIAVNCAALPADVLESELFGHVRGAFTGALSDRRGLFEAANEGTIFLDEIGDLPLSMQVKLLRVLQEGEITPVGTTKLRKVDVRVVSATNRELQGAIDSGAFRADLYYRIGAFPIPVPPLRERREDIPLMVDRFLSSAAERHKKHVTGVEPEAMAVLAAYDWPGNVRQLKNEIERAVVLTPDGEPLRASTLSEHVCAANAQGSRASAAAAAPDKLTRHLPGKPGSASLRDARAAFEARFIAEQLRSHGGNVSHTATSLGISRVMLQKKMKEYGLRE